MEKIIERIKKLLELSKSSNEHEAAIAASRAAELMMDHQISEAEIHSSSVRAEPVVEEMIDKEGKIVDLARNAHQRAGGVDGGLHVLRR